MKTITSLLLAILFCAQLAMGQNEKVNIFPFEKMKSSTNAESKIADLVVSTFDLNNVECKFRSSSVKVLTKEGTIESLVVYLLYKDNYSVETAKIILDDQLNAAQVIEDYTEVEEDFQDSELKSKGTCPDETVEMVFSSCEDRIPTAMQAMDFMENFMESQGIKYKILRGNAENKRAVKNWLACNNLKLFGRVGHGVPDGIVLKDGKLTYRYFRSLSSDALNGKVLYFNSCQVHNRPLQPAIVNAGVQKFIGGISNLTIGPSEEVFKCWISKVVKEKKAITATVFSCDEQNPGSNPRWDIYGVSGNGSDYIGNVDNEDDQEAPTAPSNLRSTHVGSKSITLAWNASTDNVGVKEYYIYKEFKLVGTSKTTSYKVTGLTPSTSYLFFVKAKDAAGNISAWSEKVNIKTKENGGDDTPSNYCAIKGENSSHFWADYFQLGSIENNSSNNGGYGDFTNQVTDLAIGENVVQVKTGYRGRNYQVYWDFWIDYNRDGSFDNQTELLVSGSSTSTEILKGTFIVPENVSTGETRARISVRYSDSSNPCGSFQYGEAEDYTVNITNGRVYGGVKTQPAAGAIELSKEEKKVLSVYPNPSSDVLNVEMGYCIEKGKIQIYNITGTLVKEVVTNEPIERIDISDLYSGTYLVKYVNGDKESSVVIVKE